MDTGWFRDLLVTKKMSQRALAKLLGLDPAAVSLMFRGKRRMTLQEAAEISELLGVALSDVMRRAGISVSEDVSLLNIAYRTDSSSKVHKLTEDEQANFYAPTGCPFGSYAIQVRDPSDIRDHTIYVVGGDPIESFDRNSMMAHVQTDDGHSYLGYLCKDYKPGRYRLLSHDNRLVLDGISGVAIRPVLWINPTGL